LIAGTVVLVRRHRYKGRINRAMKRRLRSCPRGRRTSKTRAQSCVVLPSPGARRLDERNRESGEKLRSSGPFRRRAGSVPASEYETSCRAPSLLPETSGAFRKSPNLLRLRLPAPGERSDRDGFAGISPVAVQFYSVPASFSQIDKGLRLPLCVRRLAAQRALLEGSFACLAFHSEPPYGAAP
jgi:hypothetical protein